MGFFGKTEKGLKLSPEWHEEPVRKGGRVVVTSTKPTRHQRKSLQEIPWTPAPKNRWEQFKRDAWG